MASLRHRLTSTVRSVFEAEGYEATFGDVIVSDRPDLADFQCNGALPTAKKLKKNPREVAQAIVNALPAALVRDSIAGFDLSIAGPGFINFKIQNEQLGQATQAIAADARLGADKNAKPHTVIIDYGSPNVAKSMHVGHLRSSIIGESLKRIFRFKGDKVSGDNHLGDWGTPMGMLICDLREKKPELPYFDPNFKGTYPAESPVTIQELEEMYPRSSARFKTDEPFKEAVLKATDQLQKGDRGFVALWKHFVHVTVEDQKRDFGELGITFDTWYGESFYEDKMPELVERFKKGGFAVEDNGALILPVQLPGETKEIPPVLLVKSGGGFLYHTSDLATVEHRIKTLGADVVFNVVDKRQSLHFDQVFRAAKKTGLLPDNVVMEHLAFGTMNGPDGKPFKTRSGGVLKLKDLIQMIYEAARKKLDEMELTSQYPANEIADIVKKVGIATLKFADLKNNRVSDYAFDLEAFSQFEGFTGPYLLYAPVRIQSIVRRAIEAGLKPGAILAPSSNPTQGHVERNLMLKLIQLPDVIDRAYDMREPHHLCQHGYELAQAFNSFYKECHILRETDPARQSSWLALCDVTHRQMVLLLDLLGIEVPARM